MHFLFQVEKKAQGPGACPFLVRARVASEACPLLASGQDYRFAFFTGASSTLCWPLVRAPGGLTSLLRFVEGESCVFDLH